MKSGSAAFSARRSSANFCGAYPRTLRTEHLALVAEHFEHCRTAFFRYFHPAAFDIHNVHLQRFDQKVPVVAAIGQVNVTYDSLAFRFYEMASSRNVNRPENLKSSRNWPKSDRF
jgi:hypothetical protein